MIPGYQVQDEIWKDAAAILCRGTREADGVPVLVKVVQRSAENFSRRRREYEILKGLNLPGVVEACDLVETPEVVALVMEGVHGEPLCRLMAGSGFSTGTFLQVAVSISGAMIVLHRQGVVHQSLSGANIFWGADTGEVTLCGFEFATVRSLGEPAIARPNENPAYLSPEQTGRTTRVVDHRTDLYSLGVVFYEMLSGRLPFVTEDASEMVYSHLAKKPACLCEVNPGVPKVLSEIVMKLLEKEAGDRYQTAYGLQEDLQECLRLFQVHGEIPVFEIGRTDTVERLQVSERLYGREEEVEALRQTLGDLDGGRPVLVLVSGYSGVGKTSLILEVREPVVEQGGVFLSGKFDQFAQDVPYDALVQALQGLVRKVLSGSEAQVEEVKQKLLEELGENGGVVVELIPEVGLILGEQPEVVILPPEATQNRLHLVFQNFVRVFVGKGHPLVLFLDDLQWADGPSLTLLTDLLKGDVDGLMVIGAYRDNEVGQEHPLIASIEAVREGGAPVREVHLEPMGREHLLELMGDALGEGEGEIGTLCDLAYEKTGGNPFFVKTLLRVLYEMGLLQYDAGMRRWYWKLPEIRQLDVSENVAEFLAEGIRTLPESVQRSLQVASCIGNVFDLHLVADVLGKNIREASLELEAAVRMGFLAPVEESAYVSEEARSWPSIHTRYRFLHDRMQEAADRLLEEGEREEIHLRVGQQMLTYAKQADVLEEELIEIVQHMNRGRGKMTLPGECLELAHLNLEANRKAKTSAAFEQAYVFSQTGVKWLPANSWREHYELALILYEEAAEGAYLCGDYETARCFIDTIHKHGRSLFDRIKAYETTVQILIGEHKLGEAIETGLDVLDALGFPIPETLDENAIQEEEEIVSNLLKQKSDSEVLNLPVLKTIQETAVHRIIDAIVTPAYQSRPDLQRFLTTKLVHLSLLSGNSVYSLSGYAMYGVALERSHEKMKISTRMANLSIAMLDKLGGKAYMPRVSLWVHAVIGPWNSHLSEVLKTIRNSVNSGMDVGEFEWIGRLMGFVTVYGSLDGRDLSELDREVDKDNQFIIRHQMPFLFKGNQIFHQFCLNLIGKSQYPHLLTGDGFNEIRSLQQEVEINDRNILYIVFMYKMMLSYLFGYYQEAVKNAQETESYLDGIQGMIFMAYLPFYDSLARMAVYPDQLEEEKLCILEKVGANQNKMKAWTEHAPMNFLHKYWLVEAELARVLGKQVEAAEKYDRAIALAREHRYINEEALGNELAGRFYEGLNRPRFAEVYMREAFRLYGEWGAKAKTDQLAKRYPQWVGDLNAARLERTGHTGIDVETIARASQTFSEVKIAGDLLREMLQIVVENAGAERGLLLLQKHGQWSVEAQVGTGADRFDGSTLLPEQVLSYVYRTKQAVVLEDALEDAVFREDAYIVEHGVRSVLCLPILHMGEVRGLLYLENNQVRGVFTSQRLQVLNLLASQMAVSLTHAQQYDVRLQEYGYRDRLRSALMDTRVLQEVVARTGEVLWESLSEFPSAGVRIACGSEVWTEGQMGAAGQAVYEREIVWGGRVRGRLHVGCSGKLEEWEERVFLDETAVQLAGALEARELEAQLMQSARLVSMGQMAAGVAHELNQPLGAISNTVSDLYLRLEEGIQVTEEELKGLMRDSRGVVDRMAKTIDHLRMFSRDESQAPVRPFDLNEVVGSGLRLVEAQLKQHGIFVEVDLEEGLPEVLGHANQVEQVALNLVANARDAVDERGEKETGFEKRVRVRTRAEDRKVALEVEDNGMGISEENLERVFEPFFTTKAADRGTGLGLSISYGIVKNHGGEIVCESRVGEGTVFRVGLPIDM